MDYDIIIFGGGSAGIVSGVMAGGLGMRVLLIEKSKLGGECLNTGCVPSKALIHAAKIAHTMRTAGDAGLPAFEVKREQAAGVLAKVRESIDAVREADATEDLLRDHGVEIRFGDSHFVDHSTIDLNGMKVSAGHFIIATGSRPAVPDITGLGDAYLTNQSIFDLDEIPEALLIIGGGPVGVEMAQAFARLGSRVTVVQRGPRLLPRDDSELTSALTGYLASDGIDIRLNATVPSIRHAGGRRIATIESRDGGESEVEFSRVLVATGRRPNLEGLGLEVIGVRCDSAGIAVDRHLRTTVPNVYACGDVLGKYQFSHMAEYEAKIVVRNIVFPGVSAAPFDAAPWATFTDPELVHIGLTEDEARRRRLRYEVYRQSFAQNDRAIVEQRTNGLVKVLTQGISGKILGVHILGPSAAELAQEWILAMSNGLSIRSIADLIHVYPTLSMASQHAAQRWYEAKAKEPAAASLIDFYANAIRPNGRAVAAGAVLAGAAAGLTAVNRWRRGQQ